MYLILSLPAPPAPFLRRQLACPNTTDSLDGVSYFDLNDASNQDLKAIVTYFELLNYTTQDAILEMGELEESNSVIISGIRAIIREPLGQDITTIMQTYLEQQLSSMLARP